MKPSGSLSSEGGWGGGASAALEAEQVGLNTLFGVQRAEGVTDAPSWGAQLQEHLEGPSE